MLVADAPPAYVSTTVTYADGAVAEARAECGVLDLCATITLPDGDTIRIYNKGAGRCEPFALRLVRSHGDAVIIDSELVTATTRTVSPSSQPSELAAPAPLSSCAQFKNTYFTFDGGRIRMGVFLAKDGSLFMQFAPPK